METRSIPRANVAETNQAFGYFLSGVWRRGHFNICRYIVAIVIFSLIIVSFQLTLMQITPLSLLLVKHKVLASVHIIFVQINIYYFTNTPINFLFLERFLHNIPPLPGSCEQGCTLLGCEGV